MPRLESVGRLMRRWLVSIPFFITMLYFGYLLELRIFGELIPIILAAFFVLLMQWISPEHKEHYIIPDKISG